MYKDSKKKGMSQKHKITAKQYIVCSGRYHFNCILP